jgi:hypothetical protein
MSDISCPLDSADPERPNPSITASGSQSKSEGEHNRLGGRGPLLISQIITAISGIVTSVWMARAIGYLGMEVTSLCSNSSRFKAHVSGTALSPWTSGGFICSMSMI